VAVTLEDLGNIGEFVGALGVVASLVYLAVQIRQNTRSVRTSTYHEAMRDFADAIDQLGRDAELTRIWYSGMADIESLSREERQRFATYLTSVLRRYENLLYQTQHGTLDVAAWVGIREQARYVFSQPGTRVWWDQAQNLFNPELRDFIENDLRP
jgi:hypothetical protein